MQLATSAFNNQPLSSISKSSSFKQTSKSAIAPRKYSQPINQTSTSASKQIQHLLNAARQNLQAADGPCLLKITSYLRIVCTAMQKIDQQGLLTESQSTTKYSSLMRLLFTYNPEWWQQCTITANGELESDNSVIAELLRPVRKFNQQFSMSN